MQYITLQADHAKRFGLVPAVVLHNLIYFVLKNKKDARNKHDGKYWTFNTYQGWTESMPFLTKFQIRTALRSLHEQGAISVGNYNRMRYDKTKWYSVDDALLQEAECNDYWKKRTKNFKKASDKSVAPIPNNEYIYIEPY